MTTVNITPLLRTTDIDGGGNVEIDDTMSGVEADPKNDWMYLGLRTIGEIAREKGHSISSVAGIGSGNGIVEIGMIRTLPALRTLYVTDVLPKILPCIKSNIEKNTKGRREGIDVQYLAGADCDPLPAPVDLIYGNLPLIMVTGSSLNRNRATTTLTSLERYAHLCQSNDILERWSLLSQLGFLLSAKERLRPNGSIVTLIGGRVPYDVIRTVFERARLRFRERLCAFKKQSDPEFLREYADYERRMGTDFFFYDFLHASKIIEEALHCSMPDCVPLSGDKLTTLLTKARLNAREAYAHVRTGADVGHIAFAFEAFL